MIREWEKMGLTCMDACMLGMANNSGMKLCFVGTRNRTLHDYFRLLGSHLHFIFLEKACRFVNRKDKLELKYIKKP